MLRDMQSSQVLDRKLRSADQRHNSNFKTNINPYKNPRKPMVKISSRRPLSQKLLKKYFKFAESVKSTSSIENNAQTETTVMNSNNDNNQEKIQLEQVMENKLPPKPHLSNTNQFVSSKLTDKKQLLAVGRSKKQERSMPMIDVAENLEIINVDQELQPDQNTDKVVCSNEPSMNTSKQDCPFEPVIKRANPITRVTYQLGEPVSQEISVGLSAKDSTNNQEINICSIIKNVSKAVPKTLNVIDQPFQPRQNDQLPYLATNRHLNSDLNLNEMNSAKPTKKSHDNQGSFSYGIKNDTLSAYDHIPTSVQLSSQLCAMSRKQSSIPIIQKPIDTRFGINTRNKPMTVRQPKLITSLRPPYEVVKQVLPVTGNHWDEVPQESVMYSGSHTGIDSINQMFYLKKSANDLQKYQQVSENAKNYINQQALYPDSSSNTSTGHSLLNPIHWSDYSAYQQHKNKYLRTQEDSSQRLLRKTTEQIFDQQAYLREMINRRLAVHNHPYLINQTGQFHPHEGQYRPMNHIPHLEEKIRQEQLINPTVDRHSNYRLYCQNVDRSQASHVQKLSSVPNQIDRDFEYSQACQSLQSNQDLPYDLSISRTQATDGKNRSSGFQQVKKIIPPPLQPKVSNITRQPCSSLKNYSLQNPHMQAKTNERSSKLNDINQAVFSHNSLEEPASNMQDTEIQYMSFDRSHNIQFTPIEENIIYLNPHKQKWMVDRSTKTDNAREHVLCRDKNIKSSVIPSLPKVVDFACQVDDYLIREPSPRSQEVASDHEMAIDDEIVSEQEELLEPKTYTEETPVTINSVDYAEQSTSKNSTEDRPPIVKNITTSANLQMHSRSFEEQQMLNELGSLFVQMGNNLSTTCDIFNNLQSVIIQSAETCQKMTDSVQTFRFSK